MNQNRQYFGILKDILKVARNACCKTRIVYKANLNFKIVKGYLKTLIESGLMTFGYSQYKTTERGEEFIEKYEILEKYFSNGKRGL